MVHHLNEKQLEDNMQKFPKEHTATGQHRQYQKLLKVIKTSRKL
jgi:hypothetical protein